jgi:predicted nucleic acid-binding protein
MTYVVLDTDVASATIKGGLTGPLAGRLLGATWCATFVTVGELWQWAETRNWGSSAKDRLRMWLSNVVVIDSDEEISRTWGCRLRRSGLLE